jgi:hypothetical protein
MSQSTDTSDASTNTETIEDVDQFRAEQVQVLEAEVEPEDTHYADFDTAEFAAKSSSEIINDYNETNWRQKNDDEIIFSDESTAVVWIMNAGQISDGAWESHNFAYGSWERWVKLSVKVDETVDSVQINSQKSWDNLEYFDEMTEFDSILIRDAIQLGAALGRVVELSEYEDCLRKIEAGIENAKGDRNGEEYY